MMKRIPVKLVRIDDGMEISMDMDDFESSGLNVAEDVRALKDSYTALIRSVRPVLTGKPSATERWRACKRLAEFVDADDKFDITNFVAACAQDMGLSSNLRLLLSFGREFSEDEVRDSIPYTSYRTLILKKSELVRLGIYESEKERLLSTGAHLNHRDYSRQLRGSDA